MESCNIFYNSWANELPLCFIFPLYTILTPLIFEEMDGDIKGLKLGVKESWDGMGIQIGISRWG